MKKSKATPYHENTKLACRLSGGPPEAGKACPAVILAGYENTKEEGGYVEQSALFRAFQISCFRDEVLGFYSVYCLLYPLF